jgi:hypothetical protein
MNIIFRTGKAQKESFVEAGAGFGLVNGHVGVTLGEG